MIVSVRDEGVGLPQDFDMNTGRGLGMRLIRAFTTQLAGELEVKRRTPGAEFVLTVPPSAA
jgi:two-component sensor histidine kinase